LKIQRKKLKIEIENYLYALLNIEMVDDDVLIEREGKWYKGKNCSTWGVWLMKKKNWVTWGVDNWFEKWCFLKKITKELKRSVKLHGPPAIGEAFVGKLPFQLLLQQKLKRMKLLWIEHEGEGDAFAGIHASSQKKNWFFLIFFHFFLFV